MLKSSGRLRVRQEEEERVARLLLPCRQRHAWNYNPGVLPNEVQDQACKRTSVLMRQFVPPGTQVCAIMIALLLCVSAAVPCAPRRIAKPLIPECGIPITTAPVAIPRIAAPCVIIPCADPAAVFGPGAAPWSVALGSATAPRGPGAGGPPTLAFPSRRGEEAARTRGGDTSYSQNGP